MAKRTPSPQATVAELHRTPAPDSAAMNLSDVQPLPPVAKSSGKTKAKAKPETLRDDEPLASDEDVIATSQSEPTLADTSHDVVLAQANTSSNSPSAPASVGEDLLRQAGPVPTKTTSAQDTGFFSTSWGLPVALGAGALALSGGGGGGGSNPPPPPPADTTTFTIVPYAGKFIDSTGNVTATLYKVSADGSQKAIGSSSIVKNGSMALSAKNTDLTLATGEYLKVTLVDNNPTKADYFDEAKQTVNSDGDTVQAQIGLGHDLTTLLTGVPASGDVIAVTPFTTLATRIFDTAAPTTTPANIQKAIGDANTQVATAFDIQSSITTSDPRQSPSYQKASALVSGYAASKNPTSSDSMMGPVLDDLQTAVTTSPEAVKTILKTGLSQLPPDYTNPNGNTPFVLSSLELADTTTQVNGQKTVNLINYNDGLTFNIYPGSGTRVGDQATLTFTDKGDSTHAFTYVYTFQGNSVDGTTVGSVINAPEKFTIPRFSNINPTALTEYTDANGHTLLPLTGGLPDGQIHQYTVDLVVGNASVGKGLDGLTPANTLIINTASVTLSNPGVEGSSVFNSSDSITVSVSLKENVGWSNGDPTLTLHVDDGTASGQDIALNLISGFSSNGNSSKSTNVLVFKSSKLSDLAAIAGSISIPDNAIHFSSASNSIMDVAGAFRDATWFNGLVSTALSPSLTIDSVLPSAAHLDLTPSADWITVDAQGATNGDLSSGVVLTQKNQLSLSVTVEDPVLTGTGAIVRLFWSKTSDGKGTLSLATKAVTSTGVVDFATSDYVDSNGATYIGGPTGASERGSIFYLYTQVVDAAGNPGPLSSPFKVVLDNTAPIAPELDLPTADDTGISSTDNITAVTQPRITVTGEKGSKVTLFDDTNQNGLVDTGEILATGNTGTAVTNGKYTYTWTPSTDLAAGTHHLKATLTDVAGNTSLTGALDVTVLTPLTTKPSVAFINPPSTAYNTVSATAKTITATVTYEREMYVVGTDTSGLTLQLTLAGQTRTATYSGISTDPSTRRTTLTFTYNLGSSDAGLSGSVGITGLSGAEIVVQDVAGNPAPAGVLPTTGALPTIDTQPPALPTIAIKDTEANASSATTDGAVAITAEGGATVTVTFTNTTQPTQKPQTVVVTGAGTTEVLAKLSADQVTALGQGTIKVTAEAKDAVGNSSGTTVSDSSFTLDTVAPYVTSVMDATTALVTKDNIVFTVKFSEALTTTPQKADFTVAGALGTVDSVVTDTTPGAQHSYRVTVKPAAGIPSGLVQLGFSASSTLQDAAGNKAADTQAKFSAATQAIDTQAPTVTAVSSTGGAVATGAFDFIVTFSEAMGPAAITGSPPSPSNFTVTNGTVTRVTPVTTTDGSVKYKVTVKPNSGLDAGATMKLGLVASADDTNSYIADALGNLALNADLSTGGLGGTQAIDTKAPDLPSISVKASAVNQAKATSATDGAVAIKAEDGATVTVTFTNSDDATKTPQTVVVTGKGAATDVFAALNAQQVTALGQGTIKVTAEAKDAALNSSGTTALATAPTFTLDTVAPTIRISSDKTQLKLGDTATVTFTFSEDPGTSFDASDVTVSGGTLGAISGSGLTRTATFTADKPNLSGEQATVNVSANSYTDAALNSGAAGSSSANFMLVDTVAPTIMGFTSTAVSGTYGIGSKITLRATASEAVKDSAYLDVILNSNATPVRLTRTSNPNVFEGIYTVASGDSIPTSPSVQTLQVQSFTANGTDAVGNAITTTMPVSGGNLGASLVIAGIAPLALTSFALNSASDTGLVGDYITTQNTPGFDFKGLVVGSTVKIYNGSSTPLYSFVATSVEMSNVKLPAALAVGNYANFKVVQADAIGNESPALALPKPLQIQSPAAIPDTLTGLTLDPLLDSQNAYQYANNITPQNPVYDYTTFLRTPKFNFTGGAAGNTAILFRDMDGDGKYDSTKGDILLGTAVIENTATGVHSISVDAANALANTPANQSGYTDIKVVQQDTAGQTSAASNAALSPNGPRQGLGLVISDPSVTSLADLTGFSLAGSTPADASNTETLTFTVLGVTQLGAKVVITATQLLNGVTKQITLPATAVTGTNLVVDVRGFEGTLSNFKAKQTWAGLTSADIAISGDVIQVVLDHVAPTVAISTDQALPLSQDQTCVIKFKFSEVVSDFTINKITVSSGTLTGLAQDTTDATLWTANYKGVVGSTTPAYIFVGSGAFKDAANNLNNDGADSNNILNLSFRPINHAPTAASKTISLNEDGSYTITVNDLGYSDSDGNTLQSVKITTLPAAGTLKLNGNAVSAGDNILVADITANKLVFAPVANANGANYASMGFQVQDNGGTAGGGADTSATYALNFNVASVNDAPTATGKALDLKEDSSYAFKVDDFGFADTNDTPANAFSSVIISTLPTAGTLKLNGINVTLGQTIAVADITAGNLVFTPAANASGNGYANIGFKVKDNGGTANGGVDTSAEATFTVNVASVNDAPTGANKSFTINEDSSTTLAVSDFGFADANDSPANAFSKVIITTLPTAGTLKLEGVDVVAGQSILVADITANKLVFAPVANANGNGYANIGFKVQDDGGTANGGVDTSTTANTLTFNVTSVNDAPTATGKALDLKEDSSYAFKVDDFGFADTNDTPANAFSSVIISTLPTAGTLKLNGINVTLGQTIAVADITAGNLVFTPAANASGNGYANIGFKVKDNGGTANGGVDTSAEATFTVNVASVNDAPTGANKSFTINEDSSTTLAVSDFGFADANDSPANAFSKVIITTLPTAGTLKLEGVDVVAGQSILVADITANKLVFAPVANANGTGYANIGFQVQDDGGTANGGVDTSITANTLTFNVTSVNDAPVGNVTIGGYTVGAAPVVGQQLSATHNITDVDGIPTTGPNAIHYQWYANGTEITGATGSTFTLTSSQVGTAITVKAFYKDNGGTDETVATAIDAGTSAPTATMPVAWPASIDVSGLKFFSLDSANTTALAPSSPGAKLIRGHDGVYLLDVNGDNTIDASDRTTFAQGLDATGSIVIGHLKLTLLSETTWNGLKSGSLSTYTDWPAGNTKGATGITGNDYWTSTAGTLTSDPSTSAHVVFNTSGNYTVADNAALVAATRLHYNAFQVIAV
jgi:hypothetical protein